jgi:pimeloyl-ACP methyl ester carboxylesterase
MIEATFVQIQGLRTACHIIGVGQPVLMLHGWGASAGLMWPLAQRLALCGYQAHIPDLPGFGEADTPPTGWGVTDYTNWVLGYLDHHALDQVYLVGHSFGGRLSLVLGADHPHRVIRMVLANSAGVPHRLSFTSRLRLKIYRTALNTLAAIGLKTQADRLRAWYSERYGSPDYKAARGIMRDTFVKVVNQDLLPYAARVRCPTLLLWGDQDEDTPLWQGQLLEKTIPDAGLVVYEGAGHYSYLDRLPKAAQVIDFFFKQD